MCSVSCVVLGVAELDWWTLWKMESSVGNLYTINFPRANEKGRKNLSRRNQFKIGNLSRTSSPSSALQLTTYNPNTEDTCFQILNCLLGFSPAPFEIHRMGLCISGAPNKGI
jgi:hypothetical protein